MVIFHSSLPGRVCFSLSTINVETWPVLQSRSTCCLRRLAAVAVLPALGQWRTKKHRLWICCTATALAFCGNSYGEIQCDALKHHSRWCQDQSFDDRKKTSKNHRKSSVLLHYVCCFLTSCEPGSHRGNPGQFFPPGQLLRLPTLFAGSTPILSQHHWLQVRST